MPDTNKLIKKIPLFKVGMSDDAKERLAKVVDSPFIGQGPLVDEFELELKKELGIDHLPITVNSGTTALQLALHLLKDSSENWPGLNESSQVLVCPLTCFATTCAIRMNGLGIKWTDVDLETCNICLKDLEKKITAHTKVILPVLWGGEPIDFNELDRILDRAEKRFGFRAKVVIDAAHGYLSKYNGKSISDLGHFVCYSFQAIKHLTTGDGGMITTNDPELQRRGRLLRWFGIDRDSPRTILRCEDNIPEWGFKAHLTDLNAAIGLGNISFARTNVELSQSNAKKYDEAFKDHPDITLLKRTTGSESSFWIYTLKVNRLEEFKAKMIEHGIEISQVHVRNDQHTAVSIYKTSLPQLDQLEKEMISIPVGWWLTPIDIEYIIEKINEGW